MTVTVQGDCVTVVVNNETVVDHVQIPQTKYFGDLPNRGPIGLQKHYDKPDYKNKTDKTFPMHIEFRNIFVKELPNGGQTTLFHVNGDGDRRPGYVRHGCRAGGRAGMDERRVARRG